MPLECPANYFGKGKDYILQPDFAEEFDRRWKIWEKENPEDPTGEKALAFYESSQSTERKEETANQGQTEKQALEDTKKFRLELDAQDIERLKAYAKYKRKRPRDIITLWIRTYTPEVYG
jgi:hypothetical protein